MARDPITELPADSPDPEERQGVVGDIREPQANPGSLLMVCLAIVLAGLIILLVVRLTTEPEERRPMQATPPETVQPNIPGPGRP